MDPTRANPGAGRRVLLVDDTNTLDRLRVSLERSGLEVEVTADWSALLVSAMSLRPHLVIVPRQMGGLTGGEAIARLRAFEQTAAVPVAFVLSEPSDAQLMRAVWAGAEEVISPPFTQESARRLCQLLEDIAAHPRLQNDAQHRLETLLGIYRRARRDAILVLNPGTPFEGQAVFCLGELASAEYGPLAGTAALQEMLWFEDGTWRFELPHPSPPRLPRHPAHLPAQDYRPRVLLVDDDPDVRALYETLLGGAGFEVGVAQDGEPAITAALSRIPDLILSDIDMPVLDGWGMLRRLKADHRTREIPVVFLSGQDDHRETLKAARAGAHDYLPKRMRSDAIVHRAVELIVPMASLHVDLMQGRVAQAAVSTVGVQWLMRKLAELRLTGVLEVRDEWGNHVLRVKNGQPMDAVSTSYKNPAADIGAVAALLVARGAQVAFTPGPVDAVLRLPQAMDALINSACETLNKLEAQVLARRLHSTRSFVVDEVLYELFCQLGSEQDLLVARAVCEEHLPPAELPQLLRLPPEAVEHGLREMVRRQVIRFAPRGNAVA